MTEESASERISQKISDLDDWRGETLARLGAAGDLAPQRPGVHERREEVEQDCLVGR